MQDFPEKNSDVKPKLGARLWRRWPWSAKELDRQGDDNTDNFVVLLMSLGLLVFAGIAFTVYYWGWPQAAQQ